MSGQEDGRERADKHVSTIPAQSDKEGEKIFRETMNIMAKQREGLSGQHLADSATLPSAVVKAGRAERNRQHASASQSRSCSYEGKRGEGLDCLVQEHAKTWWQWCHTSTCETKMWEMYHREHDCTNLGIQPATLYTRCIWKNVYIPVMTQHAAQVRKTPDREAGQSHRGRPERDQGFTIDVTAVSHHHIYSLQEMVLNQENWHW